MFKRLLSLFRRDPASEQRAVSYSGGHPRDPALVDWYAVAESSSGVNVTENTALNFSAVFRAVQLISGCVSTLPLHLYERDGDARKRAEHPLDYLLNDEPNDEMDASTFRETLQGHVLTWGNGYAEIVRDGADRPVALYPLSPDLVRPKRANGVLLYEVTKDGGGTKTLTADNVLHIYGLGYDGLVGYSPIRIARQSIGLGMAAEEFGARFFGNGTHLGGIIERPAGVFWSDDGAKRFKSDFANWHQGVGKSHKVAVLEDGMQYKKLGLPPNEAQFLETRKFQVTEIARWYGIPPHLLYDLERSTFSNIEQQGIEFLTYSLRYWLKKWERAIKRSLLSKEERQRYYAEHVTDDLVRADIKTRYDAYNIAVAGGWLSVNDVRRKENEPPVGGGDEYRKPLNMTDIKQPPTQAASKETDKE
jgi:HK97 family phage portal protein